MTNKQELERAIKETRTLRDRLLCDIQSVNVKLEELEKLAAKAENPEQKKEWRQKPEIGEQYFWIQNTGEIACEYWHNDEFLDKELYRASNCFPCSLFSREEVQQIAWRNQLNSLLTQYAIVNGALASEEEKKDSDENLWLIIHKDGDYDDDIAIDTDYQSTMYPSCCVLFNYRKVAEQAVEDVVQPFLKEHPEFVW